MTGNRIERNARRRSALLFLAALLAAFAMVLPSCSAGGNTNAQTSAASAEASSSAAQPADEVDGEELPVSAFSWSGGSGRLKGMDCTRLVLRDNVVYATIVMQSSSYSTMRVGDVEYENLSPGSDVSTFEIPVALGANTQISGLTTAMSSPHWVDYTIFCASDEAQGAGVSHAASARAFDDEAPEILGLAAQGKEPLDAAELFRIFNYDRGVRLLEVRVLDAPASEEAGGLYDGAVLRYLVAPAEVELAAGIEKEYIVVRTPVSSAYVLDANALAAIARLGGAGSIGMVAQDLEDASKEQGAEQVSVSGSSDNVDFRSVVLNKSDLIVVAGSVIGASRDGESLVSSYGSSATTLAVPLVIDRSADEETPKAQAEWVKLYGALLGCYESACELYESNGN